MKTLVIIPSRLSAKRLPGKPLLKINGKSKNNYIALFNTKNTSTFSYVEFDGLSINNLKNISGSISTYESDIKIDK